jgi:hypothetical protein
MVNGSLIVDYDSYFPAIGILLGWPLMAENIVDGHL